jgi:hypothetical protein
LRESGFGRKNLDACVAKFPDGSGQVESLIVPDISIHFGDQQATMSGWFEHTYAARLRLGSELLRLAILRMMQILWEAALATV